MDNTVLIGLIAGLFGAIAAGIPAYFAHRNTPSRRMSDTALIVDSTGKVVTMYREEIDRLDGELDEARLLIKELRADLDVRPTRGELLENVAELQAQAVHCEEEIQELREQIRGLGQTPVT